MASDHIKPLHLYDLPMIHKPDIPLMLTVSSIGFSCCALSDFPHKILSHFAVKLEYFLKTLVRCVQMLKSLNVYQLWWVSFH